MGGEADRILLETYFGPSGLLAANVPGYEERAGQLEMAAQVFSALRDDGTLIVEAPTGTGKTLAYLIPALLYDRRVVVATGTKNLQEQIVRKDWPFLRDALGFDARVVLMKGRANYLCKYRWNQFLAQPRFRTREEVEQFRRFADWAAQTDTGDRAEVDWVSEDDPFWSDVTSTRYNCPGSSCSQYESCFLQKMRRRASSADIIIANHHLFFADLAVKEQSGDAEVIPDFHAVIFDEAHGLEDVATGFFASRLSSFQVDELDRDVVSTVSRVASHERRHVDALRQLRTSADAFFAAFPRGLDEKRRLRPAEQSQAMIAYPAFDNNLRHLAGMLGRIGREINAVEVEALGKRVADLTEAARQVMDFEDDEFVRYTEIRGRGVHLVAEPIEPGPRVREALFANAGPVIFTSATLATDNHFRYFKGRMGIDFPVVERQLPTCFDYKTQSVLYVPRDLPVPNSPGFVEAFAEELFSLLEKTRGRALVLFTSHRNMNETYDRLAGRLPYTLMVQGQGAKSALLERFREDTHSVLLATQSFWEGVDVAGESLSCLAIDKLPFASPGEPLLEARIERINTRGGNAFNEYQVPQAIIALKQGLGRLIRRRTDKGLMVLGDVRVRTKGYGKRILSSLPAFPVTGDREQVGRYAERL